MPKIDLRILVIVVVLLIGLGVATGQGGDRGGGSNNTDSGMSSGDQQALRGFESRIRGTSDCEELMVIFEASVGAHDRFSDEPVPDISKMRMHTAIMGAADERMEEVGCYD